MAVVEAEFLEDENEQNVEELPQAPVDSIKEITTESQEASDDLPDKYRGKSVKEIAHMHMEAEKVLGRHSQEVGELRSYVDGFIKAKLDETHKAPTEVPDEDPDIEFFVNPSEAIRKAIETHPDVLGARQATLQTQQQRALESLQKKHPDLPDVIGNPSFVEWVQGSKVRQELFLRADKGYDVDAADELVSTFKERQGIAKQTVAHEVVARKKQVQTASSGSATGASSQGNGRRVFRRSDIIKLMQTDPERYEALSDEILSAYAEGRVK